MFDTLIIAVVNASVRKTKSVFTAEERIAFIERAPAHLSATSASSHLTSWWLICA